MENCTDHPMVHNYIQNWIEQEFTFIYIPTKNLMLV